MKIQQYARKGCRSKYTASLLQKIKVKFGIKWLLSLYKEAGKLHGR